MVAIAKNGVIYDIVEGYDFTFHTIIISDYLIDTDEAYIQYALPKIKEIWDQYSILNVIKLSDNSFSAFDKKIQNNGTFYKILLGGELCNTEEECFARVILKKENMTKVMDHISISNHLNVKLNASQLEKNSPIYQSMFEKAKLKGYFHLFGGYEIQLESGNIENGMTITFSFQEQYNGMNAYVLHRKKDGMEEEFIKKVENGKIDISVTELSPFLIAFNDTPNNVQTSTVNLSLYFLLAFSSFSILGILIKKNLSKK